MSAKRSYYVMCAIVLLLCVGIVGGAYLGQSALKQKSAKLVGLKAKVEALSQQELALKKAKKDIASNTDLYNIAKVVVPENKDQAQAVRQIDKLASENKIVLDSITFPSSTLGTGPSGIAGANGTGATSAAKTGNPSLSQLTPVQKIPGVYDLQLNVASSNTNLATYTQLINFLSALEHNRQTALVSSINIQPNQVSHDKFSFSLILDIYIKP